MMETVLLQINNDRAYKLLEDLEALQLVKILERSIPHKEKPSAKYAGSLHLSDEEYNSFQDSVTEGRNG